MHANKKTQSIISEAGDIGQQWDLKKVETGDTLCDLIYS
jgi:hypothetical protein